MFNIDTHKHFQVHQAEHPEPIDYQQEIALLEELLLQRQYSEDEDLEQRIQQQFTLIKSLKNRCYRSEPSE